MSHDCRDIIGDPAVGLVSSAWNIFSGYARDGFNLAKDQIQSIDRFNLGFHTWDASFSVDPTLSGFLRPVRPTLEAITYTDLSGSVPNAPTINISPIALETAPAEPASLLNPPSFDLTVKAPLPLDPSLRPGVPPTLNIPAAPVPQPVLNVALPALISPNLPSVPVIEVLPFAELAPVFVAEPPSATIDFVETPYVSSMLDAVKAHLLRLMAGEVLPPAVEAALFGRLMDRDDHSALKLTQEVREDFASRGFEAEPNGMLGRRLLEVRQTNRDKRAEANRDVYIQAQTVAIENVRFAITNGIQLEGTLIQAHLAVEGRKFDLAVKLKDVALAVFNAYVSQFNSRVLAYNARIDAYRAFLDGLKARVDVYRAQVEAAKVEGEINDQRVRVYQAQWQAETVKADLYRAQIEGFRGHIDAERAKIDGYKSQVDAFSSFVDAYKTEWDAERTRIEAEAMRGKLYETMVNGFAARVGVWQTKSGVRVEEHRTTLASAQMFLQQHESQIRAVLGRLEASKTNVSAQVARTDAQVRMYEADTRVESVATEVDNRTFQALVAKENARLEILLKDAQLQISQLNTRSGLLLRAMESAAQAASQLAASALSAVNMSAGVSSSVSRGQGCSTSFNYSGEILDH